MAAVAETGGRVVAIVLVGFGLLVAAKYQASVLNAAYAQPLWLWMLMLWSVYGLGFYYLLGIHHFGMSVYTAALCPAAAIAATSFIIYMVTTKYPRHTSRNDATAVQHNDSPVAVATSGSSNACYSMLVCQQQPPYKNYILELKRASQCNACIAQGRCPRTVGTEVLCADPSYYRGTALCSSPCDEQSLLQKTDPSGASVAKRCEQALAYGRANHMSVAESLALCENSVGNCWYGCAGTATKSQLQGLDSTATCTGGNFFSTLGDTGSSKLGVADMGSGFPTQALCERASGMQCIVFGVDCARSVTLSDADKNCFCETYQLTKEDPCSFERAGCDEHGMMMTVAQAQVAREGGALAPTAQPTLQESARPSLDEAIRSLPL